MEVSQTRSKVLAAAWVADRAAENKPRRPMDRSVLSPAPPKRADRHDAQYVGRTLFGDEAHRTTHVYVPDGVRVAPHHAVLADADAPAPAERLARTAPARVEAPAEGPLR